MNNTDSTDMRLLAVDLGKTSCRVRVSENGTVLAETSGVGAPGLADHGGSELSATAVIAQFDRIDAELLATVRGVGIGAAGVEAGPANTRRFVALLRNRLDAPIAVVSDALAAHAGAFSGGPGLILIVGTGAVAYDVDGSGNTRQIDGWGPWLGDDGGGRWIGQQGLMAALRALDGRGEPTLLEEAAQTRVAGAAELPTWISSEGSPARALASFAPAVISAADAGDALAVGIIDRACVLLAETARAAGRSQLAVVGGVISHPFMARRLDSVLASAGLTRIPPAGSALDGAAIIIDNTSLGYEKRIIRG